MKKLNLAIIGQGRSGKNIHGLFYNTEDNIYFNVKYVVDGDEFRRGVAEKLYPGCTTLATYQELFDKDDIDLVVNASYSEMHYPITKDLLNHKFNVMVEKPFGRNRYECEDLIKTAKENGVKVFVFQQTFFADFYTNAVKIIESGVLGEIKQVDLRYNGLARRWDWQTLQKRLAGSVYNTGPHPLGLALGFLDFDKNAKVVFSRLDKALTSGDAEDYAKIIITAPNKPVIDVEISAIDAFSADLLKIQGTKGTLTSTAGSYKCKYVVDGENPERPVQENFLKDENGEPIYCGENLITHEISGEMNGSSAFTTAVAEAYKDVYYNLTENKPVRITPEMATEIIAIIDKVHTDNPMPLIF